MAEAEEQEIVELVLDLSRAKVQIAELQKRLKAAGEEGEKALNPAGKGKGKKAIPEAKKEADVLTDTLSRMSTSATLMSSVLGVKVPDALLTMAYRTGYTEKAVNKLVSTIKLLGGVSTIATVGAMGFAGYSAWKWVGDAQKDLKNLDKELDKLGKRLARPVQDTRTEEQLTAWMRNTLEAENKKAVNFFAVLGEMAKHVNFDFGASEAIVKQRRVIEKSNTEEFKKAEDLRNEKAKENDRQRWEAYSREAEDAYTQAEKANEVYLAQEKQRLANARELKNNMRDIQKLAEESVIKDADVAGRLSSTNTTGYSQRFLDARKEYLAFNDSRIALEQEYIANVIKLSKDQTDEGKALYAEGLEDLQAFLEEGRKLREAAGAQMVYEAKRQAKEIEKALSKEVRKNVVITESRDGNASSNLANANKRIQSLTNPKAIQRAERAEEKAMQKDLRRRQKQIDNAALADKQGRATLRQKELTENVRKRVGAIDEMGAPNREAAGDSEEVKVLREQLTELQTIAQGIDNIPTTMQ